MTYLYIKKQAISALLGTDNMKLMSLSSKELVNKVADCCAFSFYYHIWPMNLFVYPVFSSSENENGRPLTNLDTREVGNTTMKGVLAGRRWHDETQSRQIRAGLRIRPYSVSFIPTLSLTSCGVAISLPRALARFTTISVVSEALCEMSSRWGYR